MGHDDAGRSPRARHGVVDAVTGSGVAVMGRRRRAVDVTLLAAVLIGFPAWMSPSAVGTPAGTTARRATAPAVPMAPPDAGGLRDRAACPDVLFVGARGSGQPQSGDAADGRSGLGRQVRDVRRRISADLPGQQIRTLAVRYPADPVSVILTRPSAYFDGIETGVAWVRDLLGSQATACPDEQIVLSGYSQGAMVMHRVLQDLATDDSASARAILARIDAAILIADGDRVTGEATRDYDTAGRSTGIGYALRAISGARGTRLPPDVRDRVFSVCRMGDTVCDYHLGGQVGAGIYLHAKSYDNSPAMRRATDAAARAIRRDRPRREDSS